MRRDERSNCGGRGRYGVRRTRGRVASGGAVITHRCSPYPEIGVVVQTHGRHIPLLCGPVGTRHHRVRGLSSNSCWCHLHMKRRMRSASRGHSYRWPRIRTGSDKGSSLSFFFFQISRSEMKFHLFELC